MSVHSSAGHIALGREHKGTDRPEIAVSRRSEGQMLVRGYAQRRLVQRPRHPTGTAPRGKMQRVSDGIGDRQGLVVGSEAEQ